MPKPKHSLESLIKYHDDIVEELCDGLGSVQDLEASVGFFRKEVLIALHGIGRTIASSTQALIVTIDNKHWRETDD